MDQFMESKGMPYKVTGMHQMFNMIKTKGHKSAVVANVEGHFYIGYHDPIAATNVSAALRRVRKFRVIDVATF